MTFTIENNTMRKIVSPLLGIFALWLGPGCALMGGGSDNIPKAKGYGVAAPAGWSAVKAGDSDKAYRLSSGSMVTVNSSCTRNSGAPLEILTRHLLIGSRNVVVEKRERVRVAGAEGLHSWVKATLEGVPFNLELFVLPKAGCVFDFSLVSPKGISEGDSRDFMAFIKSFNYAKN